MQEEGEISFEEHKDEHDDSFDEDWHKFGHEDVDFSDDQEE